MDKVKKSRQKYVILGAGMAIMFIVWGLGNHPLSLYSVPITTAYGFPRSLFAVVFSIINLFTAMGNLVFGAAMKRMGLKNVMIAGCVFAVCAYALLYIAEALPVFYIAAALFGLALAFVTNSPVAVLVNNWFGDKKGLALGLIFAASGIGGTVCDILVGRFIDGLGFKASIGISGIIIAVVLCLAMLVIRPRPVVDLSIKEEKSRHMPQKEGLSFAQARKTKSFWCMIVTEALWGLSIIPIVATMPSYLSDRGLEPLFVSGVVMPLLFAVSAVSKLAFGVVNDKLGSVVMVSVMGTAGAVATLLLAGALGKSGAVASALLMGVAFSCMTLPVPLLTSSLFGNRDYGVMVGVFSAVLTLAGAIGAPLCNVVFDIAGTYVPVFIVQAVFFALSVGTAVAAIKLKPEWKSEQALN